MALTRAQYLAPGGGIPALTGQVQGVKQGSGIVITTDGTISVNAGTVQGLMRLGTTNAYNGYIWPASPGTQGQVLGTDGTGNLTWTSVQGGGVTRLVAGSNVELNPASGIGVVTITATGGSGPGGLTGLQQIDNIETKFNGTATTFTITTNGKNIPVGTGTQQCIIAVGGVMQDPGVCFTIDSNASTITFTGAPPQGADFVGYIGGAPATAVVEMLEEKVASLEERLAAMEVTLKMKK